MFRIKIIATLLISLSTVYVFAFNAVNKRFTETDSAAIVKTELFEESQMTVKCEVEAYRRGLHNDATAAVTNIRSKPIKNSPIVKVISTTDEVVFSITGSNNGWFEISKVETAGTDSDKILFQGRAWVHSSQLDLDVASSDPKLYAEPSKKARVLKKLIPDGSPSEPLACKGKWMKVKSGKLTGWLAPDGQCANPLTTCS